MIETVELHISNRCTADCVVCSKAHGGHNPPYVTREVIDAAIDQIKRLPGTPRIEFGGDGDSFIHPYFEEFLMKFKKHLPNNHKELFTNGFLLDMGAASLIVMEDLLDSIQVRIDSLDPQTYRESTGLFLDVTKQNVEYFAALNRKIYFCIIYMPLYLYRSFCMKVLRKGPTYMERVDETRLKDEWVDVKQWVDEINRVAFMDVGCRVTGISLWAEREYAICRAGRCPRMPETGNGDFDRQVYIYPNGDVGMCGYDDGQDTFILGNILEHDLQGLWDSPERQYMLDCIRELGSSNVAHSCCVNPLACTMWEIGEDGEPVRPAHS